MHSKTVLSHLAEACLIGLACLLVVLAFLPPPRESGQPLRLLVDFDTSGSDRNQLADFLKMSLPLAGALDSHQDQLALFRVDCNVREFYDGAPLRSRERLVRLCAPELDSKASKGGTALNLMWESIADSLDLASLPTVVVVFSDAMPDGMTEHDRALSHKALQRIAESPQLAGLSVIGVNPKAWQQLSVDLAPVQSRLGSERLLLIGERNPDVSAVRELIDDLHTTFIPGRNQ